MPSFTNATNAEMVHSPILSWEWLVQFRRTIHMYPEPSFEEFLTAEAVKTALINQAHINSSNVRCHLGKEGVVKGGTGIIVDITGEAPEEKMLSSARKKKLIMFRADLDALRMQEENTDESIPYRSINPNCAHMCGHDGHIAALVGLAIILNKSSFRSLIPSNVGVRLVFQPAEEYIGGAEPMIKIANCLEDVDEVYGWHNWPLVELGTVLLKEGAVMAHETEFYISIKGLGGHASAPDKCNDPLVCACNIVASLQTIVSRFLPSSTNAVVSVTQFHCGPLNFDPSSRSEDMRSVVKASATNVISDYCYLSGTIRDCDRENTFLDIVKHIERIVKCVSETYQCTGELEIVEQYMETRNTKDCVEVVQRCINNDPFPKVSLGKLTKPNNESFPQMFPTNIKTVTADGLPLMGSEDFAYYLKERPGCFVIVGTKEESVANLTRFPFDIETAKKSIRSCRASLSNTGPSNTSENELDYVNKEEEADSPNQDEFSAKVQPQCNFDTKFGQKLTEPDDENKAIRRSNCCAHGSKFDFNDNVLPRIISLFLNVTSNRLIDCAIKQKLFKESIIVSEGGVFVSKRSNQIFN